MAATPKDTIYIDIDDEITGIIDKLRGSNGKIVALVLPKRATVFQSVVNMKLLKRAADDANKNLVLITAEAGLLPLAGMAGVHVAKTLTSKPEIPSAPTDDDAEETVQESGEADEATEDAADNSKTVGELAGLGAVAAGAAVAADRDGVETVELDDDGSDDADPTGDDKQTAAADKSKSKQAKPKKDKKLAVPNFERFRLLLIISGVVLVLLIIAAIWAMNTLPKATIVITTDATAVPVSLNLNLSTTATTLDTSSNTVPAKLVQEPKTYTQQVTTTGTKNEGTKASGSVTMSAQECGSPQPANDVPSGTGISANGNTYITQQDTAFVVNKIKNGCIYFDATSSTPITAQSGGASYNTPAGSNFAVAGRSDVTATGSTSGGTDNNVQVVSQSDIDNAKSKITTTDASVKQALQNQLVQEGYYAIPATFSSGTPTSTSSANPGDAASSVTVTETVTYTMFGVHESDLKTLVDNSVKSQIDTSKQSILSEGLDTASFSVNSSTATTAQLTMQTTATVGPQLNTDTIAQNAAGKKSGDVVSQLESNPDVTAVKVNLSPFWVSAVPKNTTKITVNIAKPTASTKSSNDSNP